MVGGTAAPAALQYQKSKFANMAHMRDTILAQRACRYVHGLEWPKCPKGANVQMNDCKEIANDCKRL